MILGFEAALMSTELDLVPNTIIDLDNLRWSLGTDIEAEWIVSATNRGAVF